MNVDLPSAHDSYYDGRDCSFPWFFVPPDDSYLLGLFRSYLSYSDFFTLSISPCFGIIVFVIVLVLN